jgi:hypothetical protein
MDSNTSRVRRNAKFRFAPCGDSSATEDVERTFRVSVCARGFTSDFALPTRFFNGLTSFLARRAEKPRT